MRTAASSALRALAHAAGAKASSWRARTTAASMLRIITLLIADASSGASHCVSGRTCARGVQEVPNRLFQHGRYAD
jgi:hypothetical protein